MRQDSWSLILAIVCTGLAFLLRLVDCTQWGHGFDMIMVFGLGSIIASHVVGLLLSTLSLRTSGSLYSPCLALVLIVLNTIMLIRYGLLFF